jgi:hypothetical protein
MNPGVCVRRWVLATALVTVATASPAAAAPFTWTGQGSNPKFSNASNWNIGSPPLSGASLVFGALSPPCIAGTMVPTCFYATNDFSGLAVNSIVFDGSQPYHVSGNPVSLGAGGLTVQYGGGAYGGDWSAPLILTASQTWSVTGPFSDSAPVSGTGSALTVNFNSAPGTGTSWFLDGGDSELGPVQLNGNGELQLGSPGVSTTLNGGDGQSIGVGHGTDLFVNGPATVGPLASDGSVGLSTQVLTVDGGLTLGPHGTFGGLLQGAGSGNFGALNATGAATLAGQLNLAQIGPGGPGAPCPPLPTGAAFTIISAGGALSGTFANAPPGAELDTWEACPRGQGVTTLAKIGYTPHAVTATIIPAPAVASVRSVLASVLEPKGKQARLGYLRKHGGYTFSWPGFPGLLFVDWYAKSHHKQVFVAVVNTPSFNGAAPATVFVKLTRAGKQLLKHVTKLKVRATGGFEPSWDPTVLVLAHRTFTLHH